jgi:uncharacterized protein (TIRG00374 family)
MRYFRRALAELIQPRVVVTLIVTLGILVGLLAFGDPAKVVALMERFQHIYLLWFLLLILAYEALRIGLWHFLLRSLSVPITKRTSIFTFTLGEVARDLPIGNFIPDYALQRAGVADFGLASSATLLTTLLEVAVCLAGVVIIGIDGWSWLRPLVIVGLFVFSLLLWAFYRWQHLPHKHRPHVRVQWWLEKRWVQEALNQVREFIVGEQSLLHPHVLGVASLFTATYLVISGFSLYLVILALGLSLPWYQVLAVTCFSIAFAAIVPLPVDFGSVELSGTGVLVAMGMNGTDAVSVMLINRLLNFGAILVMGVIVLAILHRDMRQVLQGPAEPKGDPQALDSSQADVESGQVGPAAG